MHTHRSGEIIYSLEELVKQGHATRSQLTPFILFDIDKGWNDWGFKMRTLITIDGSNWDYCAEDQIYELNVTLFVSIKSY